MKNKIFGKLMVASIILACVLQFLQDLFIGDSVVLSSAKMFLLLLSLISALIVVSIFSWKPSNHKVD